VGSGEMAGITGVYHHPWPKNILLNNMGVKEEISREINIQFEVNENKNRI
jgi:hypothetical protein